MRSRTAQWFECKVRYEQTQEDGLQKMVTELYTVDALSFAEAERRITEELAHYISGEFEVKDIKPAAYKEIFFDDQNPQADTYYKAKLQFITIDEKTDREKRANVTYLVQGATLSDALKNIDTVMQGTMIDYEQCALSLTAIKDVFEHAKPATDQPDGKQLAAGE